MSRRRRRRRDWVMGRKTWFGVLCFGALSIAAGADPEATATTGTDASSSASPGALIAVGITIVIGCGIWGAVWWRYFRGRPLALPPGPGPRTIPQDIKVAVAVRDGGRCRVCGSTNDLQFDHIWPYSRGGSSLDPANVQILCGYHNRLKADR